MRESRSSSTIHGTTSRDDDAQPGSFNLHWLLARPPIAEQDRQINRPDFAVAIEVHRTGCCWIARFARLRAGTPQAEQNGQVDCTNPVIIVEVSDAGRTKVQD